MTELARLSFSLERSLAERLEMLATESGASNRSELLRDLIRDRLVQREWEQEAEEVVGTVTMVYDHHAYGLHGKLTGVQHDHHDVVLATTHVHLDHDLCAEVILCRGPAPRIRAIADALGRHRGVLHASLSMSSTGRSLK